MELDERSFDCIAVQNISRFHFTGLPVLLPAFRLTLPEQRKCLGISCFPRDMRQRYSEEELSLRHVAYERSFNSGAVP